MNLRKAYGGWPVWRKPVVIAALLVPVMRWALFSHGQGFLLALASGTGVSVLGGGWCSG